MAELTRQRPTIDIANRNRQMWVPFVVGVVLLSMGLLNVHLHKAYSSDDVSQQVLLRSVLTGKGAHTLYESSDSFVIKFPLYWLISAVSYGTRSSLLGTVYVLGVAGLVLFFAAGYWLLRTEGAEDIGKREGYGVLAPLLWPLTLGSYILVILANPNLRNVEIGMAFACLALVVNYVRRTEAPALTPRTALIALLCAVLLGLFFYSDPYFEFVFFGPLAVLCVLRWLKDRSRLALLVPAAVVALAAVAASGWKSVLQVAGLVPQPAATEFATLTQVPGKIMLTVQGLLTIFNADFFGKAAQSGTTLLHILYLLPIVLLFVIHRDAGVRASLRESLLHKFLLVQMGVTVGLYILSTQSVNMSTTRYLVTVPFSGALLAAVAVNRHSNRPQAKKVALIVAAGFVSLTLCQSTVALVTWRAPQVVSASRNTGNVVNKRVVAVAEANGLTKGYADYWDASINTFFSKNKIQFLPVVCTADDRLTPYYWLLDGYRLDQPADRTFLLHHLKAGSAMSHEACGASGALARQFGEPSRILPVTEEIELYVYDGDILCRMPGRR